MFAGTDAGTAAKDCRRSNWDVLESRIDTSPRRARSGRRLLVREVSPSLGRIPRLTAEHFDE